MFNLKSLAITIMNLFAVSRDILVVVIFYDKIMWTNWSCALTLSGVKTYLIFVVEEARI